MVRSFRKTFFPPPREDSGLHGLHLPKAKKSESNTDKSTKYFREARHSSSFQIQENIKYSAEKEK